MRIPRIYTSQPLKAGEELALEERAAHYLGQVLRMRVGRELVLFNGDGFQYTAHLTAVDKKHIRCQLGERQNDTCPPSPLNLTLAIGISKGDRMDWVIQKATELGVTAIVPLYTERVDVKLNAQRQEKKQRHWQQVMISACEQSGRSKLVDITEPAPLIDWLEHTEKTEPLRLVLHPGSEADSSSGVDLSSIWSGERPQQVHILVGPEGGLDDSEVARCRELGFHCLQLGPRIMRTETAPLAALSILQYHWGDMGLW